jgi:hypothetical protein
MKHKSWPKADEIQYDTARVNSIFHHGYAGRSDESRVHAITTLYSNDYSQQPFPTVFLDCPAQSFLGIIPGVVSYGKRPATDNQTVFQGPHGLFLATNRTKGLSLIEPAGQNSKAANVVIGWEPYVDPIDAFIQWRAVAFTSRFVKAFECLRLH